MNPEDQIILVDKPAGISSFGVVAKVRSYLKATYGKKVKVGHTGTLDPFATGLLILLSGKNTKRSGEFLKKDKVYEATLKLGYTSTTGDPEGEITKHAQNARIAKIEGHKGKISDFAAKSEAARRQKEGSEESAGGYDRDRKGASPVTTGASDPVSEEPSFGAIERALQNFIGEIDQKVPVYSAVKINGERAYKLARQGASFETPTRKVTIYNIEILDYSYPELKIRTHVSSGTYIRSLAEDIGEKLGTGAYLTSLRRLKIADYDVKDAKPLTFFTKQ